MIKKAGELLREYCEKNALVPRFTHDDVDTATLAFYTSFSPDNLENISDDELLDAMFSNSVSSNSLIDAIEHNLELKKMFGDVSKACSAPIYQRGEDNHWMMVEAGEETELSNDEALDMATTLRDNLVRASRLIENSDLENFADYDTLDDELNEILGSLASDEWVQKYFHIIFPDKFVNWYDAGLLRHYLFGFGIEPSDKYYGLNGQLALIKRNLNLLSPDFEEMSHLLFGEIKHFYRLGSSDMNHDYACEWKHLGCVAVGWKNIGDLIEYVNKGTIDISKLAEVLQREYYHDDKRTATRKAGEIKTFYETNKNSIFTIMNSNALIGMVDNLLPYEYDNASDMSHKKVGRWHCPFNESDNLPETEGLQTTCYELTNKKNLLFLYRKYYFPNSKCDKNKDSREIRFKTGLKSNYSRNRIVFGAPGTGKSFRINEDAEKMLGEGNETDYERVTFHPDYSYANFVGTYKPVPFKDEKGKDAITYKYVPGPFMRIYVKALENSKSDKPKPFLLIIEEINRANVAAVFGDVFQLLDRDDNVSTYPIQVSEDVKKYLAYELGGSPEIYSNIRLPDNLFIWATMNSADQGVFPIDTAFKRRWDFEYIGIDDNDADIEEKYVLLGKQKNQKVEWNKLRKSLNIFMSNLKINEDKQLGPFFLKRELVVPKNGDEINREGFIKAFKNKVIMYLFEDAGRHKRKNIFEGCNDEYNRYSRICEIFNDKGIEIFNKDIQTEANPIILSNEKDSSDSPEE
ncbi:AAA family ATPase [Selenomonas ruminantium]|nr:AAA family ATPase [Selenomonas ruminantium]